MHQHMKGETYHSETLCLPGSAQDKKGLQG